MVKWIFNFLFFCLSVTAIAQKIDLNGGAESDGQTLKSPADKDYAILEKVYSSIRDCHMFWKVDTLSGKVTKEVEYKYNYCWEKNNSEYRRLGLAFWKKYPKDLRKYEWFFNTTANGGRSNNYWQNIENGLGDYESKDAFIAEYSTPIDWKGLNEWTSFYPNMKKEYFEFLARKEKPSSVRMYKISILTKELSDFLRLYLNKEFRVKGKFDLKEFKQTLFACAELINRPIEHNADQYTDDEVVTSTGRRIIFGIINDEFVSYYRQYGLTEKDMNGLLQTLATNSNELIQDWAIQKKSLLSLNKSPFELKGKSIDGRQIDFQSMKGKVVLVDFWATSCTSCVARMPYLKKLYDKYKKAGFEVISACYNYGNELKDIERIEQKIGADWPILMIGDKENQSPDAMGASMGGKIWKKYGFNSVPQILLFDKQGKLVAYNDVVRFGDFEPLLVSLLRKE
jgi:thiol-disulfide isomerase/thioredoxin